MSSPTSEEAVQLTRLPGAIPDTVTGRLFRQTDWAATALGPVEQWPHSLRTAVNLCLNSLFPMFVWWGGELVNIYNEAYIPVLGQRHPQAFGRPAKDTWSDIWPVLQPQVEQVLQHGQPTWNDRVLLVMERNGFSEETYFTWSYSPIYDENGDIGGLFCACTEETPRVLAERQRDKLVRDAQDVAETLRLWFDQAPGFIAVLRGSDFVFEMANQAYYQLVGHRDIIGKPAFVALPDVSNQGFEELLRGVYDSGEPFVGRGMRLMVQKEPGSPVSETFVDLVYQPVFDGEGRVAGIFAQGHDVTEQVHALQALREADRRKDEFLATLAHELRNPLAPIRQGVLVAKAPGVSAERSRWALDVIERQSRHMALLLDDLLDVSRIALGRLQLRREPVLLSAVVDAAMETARPLIDGRRHRLGVSVPTEPLTLDADPLRLAQVLSNLLSNAAKYTDEGGTIDLATEAGPDGGVAIRVRDNGIGLAPASQQTIFELFSQVAPKLDRSQGGLGIGLSLSRALVELHGGSIGVHSAGLGLGSEFVLRLPARAVLRPVMQGG
ncbi:PAS domain-containing sensor histidine kinase [Ideonella sp. BN130291]|uniref:PAS domain-containing sensor histidine kinase n=1 Tax=Ideonella sp. BN130291 TaxID=3112940 RepID=UPI002E2525E9|nr:ATP-binding protein [Ideonella sp. BN130291]